MNHLTQAQTIELVEVGTQENSVYQVFFQNNITGKVQSLEEAKDILFKHFIGQNWRAQLRRAIYRFSYQKGETILDFANRFLVLTDSTDVQNRYLIEILFFATPEYVINYFASHGLYLQLRWSS